MPALLYEAGNINNCHLSEETKTLESWVSVEGLNATQQCRRGRLQT